MNNIDVLLNNIAECNRMILHFCARKDLQMAAFWRKVRAVYEQRLRQEAT